MNLFEYKYNKYKNKYNKLIGGAISIEEYFLYDFNHDTLKNIKDIKLEESNITILDYCYGDRFGNVLFGLINFIICYIMKILELNNDEEYFIIIDNNNDKFDNTYKSSCDNRLDNLGCNLPEHIFEAFKKKYNSAGKILNIKDLLPIYQYIYETELMLVALQNIECKKKLNKWLTTIINVEYEYIYPEHKYITMHLRMSDFCSGKNYCYENVIEDDPESYHEGSYFYNRLAHIEIKDSKSSTDYEKKYENIKLPFFPILSYIYYENALSQILSNNPERKTYYLIIFYKKTIIDNYIVALYKILLKIKFPDLLIFDEYNISEIIKETKNIKKINVPEELKIMYMASLNEYIIMSNSTFGYFMQYFARLREYSNLVILNPDYLIYSSSVNILNIDYKLVNKKNIEEIKTKFPLISIPDNETNLSIIYIIGFYYHCLNYKYFDKNPYRMRYPDKTDDFIRFLLFIVYLYLHKDENRKFTINGICQLDKLNSVTKIFYSIIINESSIVVQFKKLKYIPSLISNHDVFYKIFELIDKKEAWDILLVSLLKKYSWYIQPHPYKQLSQYQLFSVDHNSFAIYSSDDYKPEHTIFNTLYNIFDN